MNIAIKFLIMMIMVLCVSCGYQKIGEFNENIKFPCYFSVELCDNRYITEDNIIFDLEELKNLLEHYLQAYNFNLGYNNFSENYIITIDYINNNYKNSNLVVFVNKIKRDSKDNIIESDRVAVLYPGKLTEKVIEKEYDPMMQSYLYREYIRKENERAVITFNRQKSKKIRVSRLNEIAYTIIGNIAHNIRENR